MTPHLTFQKFSATTNEDNSMQDQNHQDRKGVQTQITFGNERNDEHRLDPQEYRRLRNLTSVLQPWDGDNNCLFNTSSLFLEGNDGEASNMEGSDIIKAERVVEDLMKEFEQLYLNRGSKTESRAENDDGMKDSLHLTRERGMPLRKKDKSSRARKREDEDSPAEPFVDETFIIPLGSSTRSYPKAT